jgi:ribosomal protein S11
MLLLKIVNKSLFSHNLTIYKYVTNLYHIIKILKFVKKEAFAFFTRWLFLFIFTNVYNLKIKASYSLLYIYYSFFYNQKLVSHILNINLLPKNTLINVNNIKGNPKFFYSAGMLHIQKKQKFRQPKAVITILKALLLKLKISKAKPVAVHFNNVFFNYQSHIFNKLKSKIFAKLVQSRGNQPHNGCRLKKKKRIKIRTRAR